MRRRGSRYRRFSGIAWRRILTTTHSSSLRRRGTGKSTCVDVLEWLVGEENKVSLELTELDNAFTRSQLVGKSLALAKELTTKSFKHIGLIKAIVSGDPIAVDVKFGQGYSGKVIDAEELVPVEAAGLGPLFSVGS